jgi:uncharacterized ferritin-like protein (DUF455 family)
MSYETAAAAWTERDATQKVAGVMRIEIAQFAPQVFQGGLTPGTPESLVFVHPRDVPVRGLGSREGRAALLHAIAHIEFNAINIALDAALRFPDFPAQYYTDWLRVAKEEAYHFSLLADYLQTYGVRYGEMPVHNGLWGMVEKTAGDRFARMALVPRVLEARGLDVTPTIAAKLARAGDTRAAEILAIILRDEVAHVAIGNHWYHWLCAQHNLDSIAAFSDLRVKFNAPAIVPPLNTAARLEAGFSEAELNAILHP